MPVCLRERFVTMPIRSMLASWGQRNSEAPLLETLPELGRELEMLTESTESEFLTIGENLQHFHRRTVEIAGMSEAVSRVMTGEDVDRVIASFGDIIERMGALERESKKNAESLSGLLEIAAALTGQLTAFQKTVRSLRILCISIKIESARLGGDDMGFGDLGSDVGSLALEIEERCARLSSHAESLAGLLHQALIQVRHLECRQREQGRFMVDTIMVSLRSLTEKHARSLDMAQNLATRFQSLSRSIGQIVGSMQFHDITRQQIEHAKEALDLIMPAGPNGNHPDTLGQQPNHGVGESSDGGVFRKRFMGSMRLGHRGTRDESTEVMSLAADVCGLQMAQLQHARDGLVGAVNNILNNLRAISSLVMEMSLEAHQIVGAAGAADGLSLDDIRAGFTSILAAHSGYVAAGEELASVMTAVSRTLGDMSGYTGDIEGIGAKIKLIALNAIVKAAHIGENGVSLGVLAEGIHQLSMETGRQTEIVAESLGSIISASALLGVDGGGRTDSQEGVMAHLEAALKTLPDTLEMVNGELLGLLKRMESDGRELSAEILEVVENVSVHRRVAAVIDRVVSRLGEIVEASASRRGTEDELVRTARLQALEASYTMEEERGIHQAVFGSGLAAGVVLADAATPPDGGAQDPQAAAAPGGEEEENLGDNVELF